MTASARHYFPITTLMIDVGEPVPDFIVDGGLGRYRGRPLLVNFYSAYCPPCIREIPVLNAFIRQAGDLQALAISVDDPREAATLQPRLGLAWPVVAPGEDYAYRAIGIEGIPAFLLLDARGNLLASTYSNQVADGSGEVTLAGLLAWIEHAMRRPSDARAQPGDGMSAIRQR